MNAVKNKLAACWPDFRAWVGWIIVSIGAGIVSIGRWIGWTT